MEEILFCFLAAAVLKAKGCLGLADKRWNWAEGVYASEGKKWGGPNDAVGDLIATLKRNKKEFDSVVFYSDYDGLSGAGVTWRMLKLDMSFLRIVLAKDETRVQGTLAGIISRLVEIMNEASGFKERYDGRN